METLAMAAVSSVAAGPSTNGCPAGMAINQFEENVEHLRQLFSQNKLVSFSIAHIACSAGSSSGDNYMSVVKRVTISQAVARDQEQPAANETGKF